MSEPESAPTPHDAFIKEAFSKPERAAALIKTFLPPAVVRIMDLGTLKLMPGQFVQKQFRQVETDLLFEVKCGKTKACLYFLFEHQSKPDKDMPLRLLGYMLEIFRAHRKKHPGSPLPPIIPMVFNQGPQPWNFSTSFGDSYGLDPSSQEVLSPYLLNFEHALLDLTKEELDEPMASRDLEMILKLAKWARLDQSEKFLYWLRELHDFDSDAVILCITYVLKTSDDLDIQSVRSILKVNKELEKTSMTLYEKIEKQGIEKGRQEGRQEGREEGEIIGKIEMIEEFIGEKIHLRKDLETMPLAQLKKLFKSLESTYSRKFKKKK